MNNYKHMFSYVIALSLLLSALLFVGLVSSEARAQISDLSDKTENAHQELGDSGRPQNAKDLKASIGEVLPLAPVVGANSSQSAPDIFKPSEQVSEDLSVSFPSDI